LSVKNKKVLIEKVIINVLVTVAVFMLFILIIALMRSSGKVDMLISKILACVSLLLSCLIATVILKITSGEEYSATNLICTIVLTVVYIIFGFAGKKGEIEAGAALISVFIIIAGRVIPSVITGGGKHKNRQKIKKRR